MAWAGWSPEDIFWQLAVEDIRAAADLFEPLYESTEGGDGYVSLEVDPNLAHETSETLQAAKRLWKWVDRPNLMIKIPATLEGIPAIRKRDPAGTQCQRDVDLLAGTVCGRHGCLSFRPGRQG